MKALEGQEWVDTLKQNERSYIIRGLLGGNIQASSHSPCPLALRHRVQSLHPASSPHIPLLDLLAKLNSVM
jgi:hypothetical protein